MKTYFREKLSDSRLLLGTYDGVNNEYNLSIRGASYSTHKDTTISFSEGSKGWTSFKSFVPDTGSSVSGKYFTAKDGTVYVHDSDIVERNSFYSATGVRTNESSLKVMFNDLPGSIKTFHTVNYEGSQARVTQFTSSNEYYQPDGTAFDLSGGDGEYYNLEGKDGWWVQRIITDQSKFGDVTEFIDKEGKWFNRIGGDKRQDGGKDGISNLDLNEFSVQGLGVAISVDDGQTERPVEDINLYVTSDFIDDPTNTID